MVTPAQAAPKPATDEIPENSNDEGDMLDKVSSIIVDANYF